MAKYRVAENDGKLPENGKLVVQCTETIETRSIFTLVLLHALVCSPDNPQSVRRCFIAKLLAGGVEDDRCPCIFGDDEQAHSIAKGLGLMMLEKNIAQLSGLAIA